MKNGQDAAELPRRKRGRPPGSRKTTSTSEQRRSERQDEQISAAIDASSDPSWQKWSASPSPLLNTNEEQIPYELVAEENLSAFGNTLRTILRRDRAEITRVARELEVAENTVYRWMNGSSEPRAIHLRRLPDVLQEHRLNLTEAINQTFPGILDTQAPYTREVNKDIYQRVLELVAMTPEPDTRFWQVSQAIFEYALLSLDAERQGMAITFAKLMPAREDGIHSLREIAMRGNAPWPFDIESKAYLGSTTLAGTAVTTQRMLVWSSLGSGDRHQVEVDEYEASACAVPVMRGGSIAGALIVSSAYSRFFEDPIACQAVVEYAQLLATALTEQDFHSHTLLNLRPMPDLKVQRAHIAHSYVSRILIYARKYDISRIAAEMRVRQEMELEFEALARASVE